MTPVHVLVRLDDALTELVLDPSAWVPVGPDGPQPGPSRAAATLFARRLSTAETADCTCDADCLRDHGNE